MHDLPIPLFPGTSCSHFQVSERFDFMLREAHLHYISRAPIKHPYFWVSNSVMLVPVWTVGSSFYFLMARLNYTVWGCPRPGTLELFGLCRILLHVLALQDISLSPTRQYAMCAMQPPVRPFLYTVSFSRCLLIYIRVCSLTEVVRHQESNKRKVKFPFAPSCRK